MKKLQTDVRQMSLPFFEVELVEGWYYAFNKEHKKDRKAMLPVCKLLVYVPPPEYCEIKVFGAWASEYAQATELVSMPVRRECDIKSLSKVLPDLLDSQLRGWKLAAGIL